MIKIHPDMTMLPSKALVFAQEKHGNQLDDDGKNYFDYHVQPVAIII